MRFERLINEDIPEPLVDQQKSKLFKNCKPFLTDVKKRINRTNHFLFRGMTGAGGKTFIEKTVRQDRRPLDSDPRWHDDFGAGFVRKFGVDARKQGLFCEMLPVHQYGFPYIVIPQGRYYCIWSDTIQDAAEWVPDAIYGYAGVSDGVKGQDNQQIAIDKHVDKLMKTYHKGDLGKAILGVEGSEGGYRTEITVICKKYYAIGQRHQQYLEQWIRNEI